MRLPLLATVLLIGAACAPAVAPAVAPAPTGPAFDVRITKDNDFSDHAITLPTGGTVRWTNDSAVSHTVTFTDALRIPADNGTFNKKVDIGTGVSRTFPVAGTYLFFCLIHPGMQGQVTVGAP